MRGSSRVTDGQVSIYRPRLLGAVFFGSGFAALIYQITWQRLLTIYYGVGPISVAVVVSVFLLGLGLGSVAGGYLAERVRLLASLYGLLEIVLAAYGAASIFLLYFICPS